MSLCEKESVVYKATLREFVQKLSLAAATHPSEYYMVSEELLNGEAVGFTFQVLDASTHPTYRYSTRRTYSGNTPSGSSPSTTSEQQRRRDSMENLGLGLNGTSSSDLGSKQLSTGLQLELMRQDLRNIHFTLLLISRLAWGTSLASVLLILGIAVYLFL